MKRMIPQRIRRFFRREDGSVTMIEFCVVIPLVFTSFLMSMEMGIHSVRQMFLDRGLDITVRFIRLNTNVPMTHESLKTMICDNAVFLPNCTDALNLEMVSTDMREFTTFDEAISCVDLSEPVEPSTGEHVGLEHEMMILRACYSYDPIFATSTLGKEMNEDGTGARMISIASFVQEPG